MKGRKFELKLFAAGALSLVAGAAVTLSGQAADPVETRYPYDPACPWGRIADGRGMLVRCLLETESKVLLQRTPAPAEDAPPADAGSSPEASSGGALEVSIGPVTADVGTLPMAAKKLELGKPKFENCVLDNGGLESSPAEVHVRFLVRERGRAEGVSVSKLRGVSKKVARCVADVVDRRYVGEPEAPLVGATVVIKFSQ
jgi:hypothetical protein